LPYRDKAEEKHHAGAQQRGDEVAGDVTTARVRPDLLYAWKGPSLLVTNTRGECGDDRTLSGYYFREARFLRRLRLTLDGDAPWLCEAAALDPQALSFSYIHPEVAEYGGAGSGQPGDEAPTNARGTPQRALAIHLLYTVTLRGLAVDLTITNRDENGRSHGEILTKRGTLHLLRQQPPESLSAGPWDRFRAILDI
jgi:hypothetical protein